MLKLLLFRIVSYLPVLIDILFLRMFLDNDGLYGSIEFWRSTFSILLYFSLGSGTGLVSIYFKNKIDLLSSYTFYGVLTMILTGGIGLFFQVELIGIAALVFYFLHRVIEKFSEIHGLLRLQMAVRGMMSLTVLIYAVVSQGSHMSAQLILAITLLSSLLILCVQLWMGSKQILFDLNLKPIRFRYYIMLIKKGLKYYLLSFFFLLINYIDRFVIQRSGSEYLADYSFSFNLVMGAVVVLSTLGIKNIKLIGDNHQDITIPIFNGILKNSLILMLLLLFGLLLFSFVLELYFDYTGLLNFVIIQSLGILLFYSISTVSSIVYYIEEIEKVLFLSLSLVIVKLVFSVLVENVFVNLSITSVCFALYSIYLYRFIIKRI